MQGKLVLNLLLLGSSWLAIPAALVGQDSADPFTSAGAAGGSDAGWQGTSAVIGPQDPITSGGIGCPVIVAGSQVFAADTFALKQTLDVKYEPNTLTALSADGTYFAVASKPHMQMDNSVRVYDVATGKKVSEIPGDPAELLEIVQITRNKYIVTAGRVKPVVRVWNAETGEKVKEFPFGVLTQFSPGKLAFTADGHYMAAVSHFQIQVIGVAKSKVAATMEPPTVDSPIAGRRAPVVKTDHAPVYAWIQDMRFSPDGKQLAAVSTHEGNRILCWSNKGKLEVNQTFTPVQQKAFWENDLQWLPEGNVFLVGGNLVDGASGEVLLAFDEKFGASAQLLVQDQKTVVGRLGSKPNQLSKFRLPWEAIERSRQAMEARAPAYIAPYQPVGIKIEVARGAGADAEQKLTEAIKNRLQRDKVNYQPGAANFFLLRFSESKGDTLPIFARQSRFDFKGVDTGQTATEAKGSLIVEFHVEGRSEPLWREVFDAKSSRTYHEEITQATIRESMLRGIASDLSRMHFPYFMPRDENLSALPIIVY